VIKEHRKKIKKDKDDRTLCFIIHGREKEGGVGREGTKEVEIKYKGNRGKDRM
jgi:hypothetical protein